MLNSGWTLGYNAASEVVLEHLFRGMCSWFGFQESPKSFRHDASKNKNPGPMKHF